MFEFGLRTIRYAKHVAHERLFSCLELGKGSCRYDADQALNTCV